MTDEGVLRIGDGKRWMFINGAWCDGPENALAVPDGMVRQDGPGMQGHHYAFLRDRVYGDVHARFQFRLTSHSDAGIILRAADASHFYLLHFPNCGQGSRAQHFWAALSRMDETGYLKTVKLEMVRRVPSTNRLWLDADVHLIGDRLIARIGGTGVFEVSDTAFRGPGRVGAFLFGDAEIRDLSIDGEGGPSAPWNDRIRPRTNWFHPHPDTEYGLWQRPGQLVRTPGGDLLLNYNVQEYPYQGKVTPLMTRSTGDGRIWSRPQPVEGLKGEEWQGWGIVHIFPDGVLRMMISGEDGFQLAETTDDGHTWSPPVPIQVAPPPPGMKRIHIGPQAFVNLEDGSMVMLGYGGHDSSLAAAAIFTWGSHHCQAFACRSEDNGRTWSEWVNVDGTRDQNGDLVDGSFDLTEVCGVQTGDGHILALIRPIYSPWMWETWSSDGGASWTPCVRGPFPGYATPNMLRTASGAILVAHRLPGCTIHTSLDDGLTWDHGTLIDSAIWVMGGMIEVAPDVVLYVYYDSFESLMRAQFIRVTPGGLVPVEHP